MSPIDKPTLQGQNTLHHIAVIMDGNGRWAKKRHLPRFSGHKAGLETVREMVKSCVSHNVKYLTLFAFSSENWRRPEQEVGLLMELFLWALKKEVKKLHKSNVKLNIIGDITQFPDVIQQHIELATAKTKDNTGLTLTIAANYGGRWDIVQAVKKVMQNVKENHLTSLEMDEVLFESYLQTATLPEPDLFIRTGGEQRISNFMLWNLAYSEFYFTDKLWPDFKDEDLLAAIASFNTRQRRFGRTGDQLLEKNE